MTALSLTGCSLTPSTPSQLNVPQTVIHNDKTYYLAGQRDLGSMARYFYTPKNEMPQQWQSAVELLQDRNIEQRTLADRIALRQRIYKNTGVKYFDLSEQQNTLYAVVIYEPTSQNKDWQIDVAKGKNIPLCGFVQYQYSFKVEQANMQKNITMEKLFTYLKQSVAERELAQLKQQEWHWGCR